MLVKESLDVIKGMKFGADISLGFDSTLINYLLKKNTRNKFISYCEIAKDGIEDTDPDIVLEFPKKHSLGVKFVSYDKFFPFSTDDDLSLIKKGQSFIQKSQLNNYLRCMKADGNLVRFTGEGGDEVYWSNEDVLNLTLKFPAQMRFFNITL